MAERIKPRLLRAVLPFLLVLLGLAACVSPPPAKTQVSGSVAAAATATASPRHLPPGARADLSQEWVDPAGGLRWPPDDGFAGTPVAIVLPPGMLIDRFGAPTGRFFSPRGASFAARALPYACEGLAYTTYRVERPLFVWAGKAAAWFDERGGATQFETDAPAALLIADHVIAPVHAGPASCN